MPTTTADMFLRLYGASMKVRWEELMKSPVDPTPLSCHCTIFNTEPDCVHCNAAREEYFNELHAPQSESVDE